MSAGLLHMWLALLSCSLSPAPHLPTPPPQLLLPAPLWKPPFTEPSLARSSLSDTRSILCVPRASNWLAPQHAFAVTTALGAASTLPAKVSVNQLSVDQFNSLGGVTLETQNQCFPIFKRYIFHMFIGFQENLGRRGDGFLTPNGVTWQLCIASYWWEWRHLTCRVACRLARSNSCQSQWKDLIALFDFLIMKKCTERSISAASGCFLQTHQIPRLKSRAQPCVYA